MYHAKLRDTEGDLWISQPFVKKLETNQAKSAALFRRLILADSRIPPKTGDFDAAPYIADKVRFAKCVHRKSPDKKAGALNYFYKDGLCRQFSLTRAPADKQHGTQ